MRSGTGKSTSWNILAESIDDPPDAYVVIVRVEGVDSVTGATVVGSDDIVINVE